MSKKINIILIGLIVSLVGSLNLITVHADDFNYDSIPMSQVSYSDSTIHSWGMVVQNNAIYLSYNNDPKGQGTTTFQGYGFNFKLGDQQAVLNIDGADSNNVPTKVGQTANIKFQTNNYSSNIQQTVTGTVLVRENGNADHPAQILHIMIPLSAMVKVQV
ncbi:Firmicu-CTERM sorting domain-containing protein [Weissella coleopterorum]|uniref:Firmicu-CTERM sorting domain-containing protein n=1 Tax=Weissella coleopterorum TaxID=2714949 RepID=UPI001FE968DD|nr:Firmicu-CTERM sorting domain-containing protein [Weissella coleopterorum]